MKRMRGEMNSPNGYVLIIGTNGDVTSTTDDGKEQPWLSTECDPQPKGLPFIMEPENQPAPRAWARIGQSY